MGKYQGLTVLALLFLAASTDLPILGISTAYAQNKLGIPAQVEWGVSASDPSTPLPMAVLPPGIQRKDVIISADEGVVHVQRSSPAAIEQGSAQVYVMPPGVQLKDVQVDEGSATVRVIR